MRWQKPAATDRRSSSARISGFRGGTCRTRTNAPSLVITPPLRAIAPPAPSPPAPASSPGGCARPLTPRAHAPTRSVPQRSEVEDRGLRTACVVGPIGEQQVAARRLAAARDVAPRIAPPAHRGGEQPP